MADQCIFQLSFSIPNVITHVQPMERGYHKLCLICIYIFILVNIIILAFFIFCVVTVKSKLIKGIWNSLSFRPCTCPTPSFALFCLLASFFSFLNYKMKIRSSFTLLRKWDSTKLSWKLLVNAITL